MQLANIETECPHCNGMVAVAPGNLNRSMICPLCKGEFLASPNPVILNADAMCALHGKRFSMIYERSIFDHSNTINKRNSNDYSLIKITTAVPRVPLPLHQQLVVGIGITMAGFEYVGKILHHWADSEATDTYTHMNFRCPWCQDFETRFDGPLEPAFYCDPMLDGCGIIFCSGRDKAKWQDRKWSAHATCPHCKKADYFAVGIDGPDASILDIARYLLAPLHSQHRPAHVLETPLQSRIGEAASRGQLTGAPPKQLSSMLKQLRGGH